MSYYISTDKLKDFSASTLLDFQFKGEPYEKTHNLRKCDYCGERAGLFQSICTVCKTNIKNKADMNLAKAVRDWRYQNDSLYRSRYDSEMAADSKRDSVEFMVGTPCFLVGVFAGFTYFDHIVLSIFGAFMGAFAGLFLAMFIVSFINTSKN
jgi:hypothetical protein